MFLFIQFLNSLAVRALINCSRNRKFSIEISSCYTYGYTGYTGCQEKLEEIEIDQK